MASSTNNSLTQFLTQLLRIQSNSMEIIATLSEISTSTSPSVQVDLKDQTGATQSYELSSMGYIQNQIARIDNNFKSLIGQDGNDVTVRMPDGSFKKIFQSTLFKEPKKIGNLVVPSTFGQKNNWFFESFLNPLLYVAFDVTKYVDYNTRHVAYKRIIVNTNSDTSRQYFDSNYKGRNDIDYATLLNDLAAQQISYFVDEDVTQLPVSVPRFEGKFDVIKFTDQMVSVIQTDGSYVQQMVRKYQLNTLKYTDTLQKYQNTKILAPGDSLDVGTSSQYKVVSVDTSTNSVVLQQTSGVEPINIGTDVLSISVSAFAIKEVQINVGYNEREVIFMKSIDQDTNLTTSTFSPGVAFWTNELSITTSAGTTSLADFYKSEVMDFGIGILGLVKEGTVPAIYGEIPDPPTLNAADFQVVLVNSQKQDTDAINNLKKKITQKTTIASQIAQLETAITNKKQDLNTTKFNTDAERQAVEDQLTSLINDKTAQSNLYASIITDLSTTAKNLPPELSKPKYSIRGFFPIPSPKSSNYTSDQNTIQFIVSFRYLAVDGTSIPTQQINYIDNNGQTVRGYFSNWKEVPSKIRPKIYDSATGTYIWKTEDTADADTINCNQIDIPITPGEQVEIRVKSVSEAGWPVNPLMSEWSNSVIISFPDNLSSDQEVLASLADAQSEQTRVNFNADLNSKGLDLHLSTSFLQKDKYFAHSADTITSGFYNSDNSVMTLYQKLQDLQNQILSLASILEQAKGTLSVTIVDPSGTSYNVTNNSTVDLFAGFYSDIVSTLPVTSQKGAIITTIYKIVISNSAASVLRLASRFPGGLNVGLPNSSGYSDVDYANSRRYDIVPISLASLDASKTDNSQAYQAPPFQSAQQLSQFLYVRYTDIGLSTALYGSLTGAGGPIENNTYYPDATGAPTTFVWDYTYSGTAPNGNGALSNFCIHTLHPSLNDGTTPSITDLTTPSGATSSSPAVYPTFAHSAFFNAQSSDVNGKLQARYYPTSFSSSIYETYPLKLGFYTNDRYLIGQNTCGAYLFLAPATYSDLLVEGTDFRAVKEIEQGASNSITIPVIFQYRMTDFFGNGTSGLGNIGGFTTAVKNLSYTKKIGIDISPQNDTIFSFDIQIQAKYKSDSPSQTAIKPATAARLSSTQAAQITRIF